MKLVFICSAGGGSVLQAFDMARAAKLVEADQFLMVTDRLCGAETEAGKRGISTLRLDSMRREDFSHRAADAAVQFGADAVLLAFSRLVSGDLFETLPTLNIHPSLLPSFPGIGAVAQARRSSEKVLGASLHRVDAGMDTGPVLAQAWSPVGNHLPASEWDRRSFIHKSYLALLLVEQLLENGTSILSGLEHIRTTASASPALSYPSLISRFGMLVWERDVVDFIP